jgi:3-oxoacyl-(acyl-carrier-protein) synthase
MSESDRQRIAFTGCGWVTPFAHGTIKEVLQAAPEVEKPQRGDRPFWPVPEQWREHVAHLPNELKRDKGCWITAVAMEHACRQAGIQIASLDPVRVGLVLGCELAGQLGMIEFANEVRKQSARFVSPIHFPQTVGNYISGAIARGFHIRGPNLTIAGGPASSLDAIVEGAELLSQGTVDFVLAGGVDVLSQAVAESFAGSDALPSEAACLFVLERIAQAAERGAPPLAVMDRPTQSTGINDTSVDAAGRVVSTAGFRREGAICIRDWIGRCFGAEGAAAVAAAIGAASGERVPVACGEKENLPSTRTFYAADQVPGDESLSASVLATDDSGRQTRLDLSMEPTT